MKSISSMRFAVPALLLCLVAGPLHAADPGSTNDVGAPAPGTNGTNATTAPNAVSVSYTIDASTTTMQAGRLNRDGVGATCAAPKTQTVFNTSNFRYVASAPLYNTSNAPVCATITATPDPACDANIFPVAYLGSFDSANILTNYLGDPGYSFGIPPSGPLSFSVTVPANGAVVVDLVDTAGTGSCTVTLTSPELSANVVAVPAYVPVPTLGKALALLLGLALFVLALVAVGHRRKQH